jgi:mono/diheme cytochrome c family protein
MKPVAWSILGVALLGPAALAWAQLPPAAFAPAQAAAGETVYAARCAVCHGATLTGGDHGPALSGAGFWAGWQGKPARALYSRVISTMPYDDPGSLSEADTIALTALIARSNGAPDGPAVAAASSLDTVALAPAK